MRQYVIGNDIDDISWDIYAKHEVPENFDDAQNIEVFAQHCSYQAVRIPDKSDDIQGNRLILAFLGTDMRRTGVYDLVLTYGKTDAAFPGGMRHYRITNCATFELVEKSCEVDVPDDPLVIEGIIAPLRGYSAYEVAVKNGFSGTEEEWLSSLKGDSFEYDDFTPGEIETLQQPAREAAVDAEAAADVARQAALVAGGAAENANRAADGAEEKAGVAQAAAENANVQAAAARAVVDDLFEQYSDVEYNNL